MRSNAAFTLIELLVVIAIVAVLAALLFPVLSEAKKRGQTTACLNNLKQLSGAFQQYRSDFDDTMPSLTVAITGPTDWCGSPGLRRRIDPAKGQLWRYTRNRDIYECPVDTGIPAGQGTWPTPTPDFGLSYSVSKWLHVVKFDASVGSRPSKMLFMIHESRKVINDGFFAFGGGAPDVADRIHYDGTAACYCDGHARYYPWEELNRQMRAGDWDPPWYRR